MSEENFDRIAAVMRADHPAVAAVRGSGDELPFEGGAFDAVLTVAALHHVAEPTAVRDQDVAAGRLAMAPCAIFPA